MAQQPESDNKKYEFTDLVDIEVELAKRKELVEFALTPTDDTWTIYNTKDDNISVAYKQIGNSGVYTVVGKTKFDTKNNGNINDYYKYQECGFSDVYSDESKRDANTIDLKILVLVDKDHQLVYNASKSGYMLIGNRDFTYMKTRFQYDNYKFNDKVYNKIVCGMSYSVNENNPYYVKKSDQFVRADLQRNGYVLWCDSDNLNEINVCYVLTLDPSGSIPQWVVNSFAPSKGMGVKKFVESWDSMMETKAKREANNNKKDFVALFDTVNPKLACGSDVAADAAAADAAAADASNDNSNDKDANDATEKDADQKED